MNEFVKRAEKVFVGGVNSPVRSFRRVGGHPIVAKSADGAYLTDVDGKTYVDLVMSYGPHLFGHQHAPIVEALQASLRQGFCYGMTSEKEIEWGEKVVSFLPTDWKVRALCSGTEACMTAIRLARGHTGREIIVKCSGHYHGHVDSLLFDAGSGLATLCDDSIPDSDGLPRALADILKVVPFNDVEALEKVFVEFGSRIAGFILEPVMGNMGVVLPQPEFLQAARRLTEQHQALLIFDEVMTGFRVGKDSAHGRFGVRPDIICFGKIVGGGLPLAALAAPRAILESLAPTGKVYQAGTLSGNPLAVSAGLAMLTEISRADPYSELEKLSLELENVISAAARKKGVPVSVVRCGSMISTHFRAQAPRNAAETRDIDGEAFKSFFWNAVKYGLMLPPSPFEAYFLSTRHLPIRDEVFEKFEKAIGEL